MKTHLIPLTIAALSFLLGGCEKRFDLSVLPNPGAKVTIGDTSYVELEPAWGGFQSPRAVYIGLDQLIYVVDHDANEIVMMDFGGTVLKRRSIPHPISITQNFKLDLYVGAEAIAPNGVDTIGAIYRISLVRRDTTYQSGVDIRINPLTGDTTYVPIYRDTSFFANHNLDTAHMSVVWQEPAHPARRFPGLGVLPGNVYLAARIGPENGSFNDPDTRVLEFNNNDEMITPLPDLSTRAAAATAITDIKTLTGLIVIPSTRDFVVTQSSEPAEHVAYGAIWMSYVKTNDFQGWLPKFDPSNAAQATIDFVAPYRFQHAAGAAYDTRGRNLFIVDSDLDSVFKFGNLGQLRSESFGYWRTNSSVSPGLRHPSGIAFSSDFTLYIADTGNRIIRRFRLSTQL